MLFKWPKKMKSFSRFCQNVWKHRLISTVTLSFNTTVRQFTEMSQWPKCLIKIWPNCLCKKWPEVSAKKNRSQTRLPYFAVVLKCAFLSLNYLSPAKCAMTYKSGFCLQQLDPQSVTHPFKFNSCYDENNYDLLRYTNYTYEFKVGTCGITRNDTPT